MNKDSGPLMNKDRFTNKVDVSGFPDGSVFFVVGIGAARASMAIHDIDQVRELHYQLSEILKKYDAR